MRRGGRDVLHGVDAAFAAGSVGAIVGPSGAGKTSLLRCFNRLEEPDEGFVALDGTDVRTLPPTDLRRRVGMIFQTPQMLEGTIADNLTYGLDGVTRDVLVNALRDAALSEDLLDRRATALSLGQAQRVSIARALVRDPHVLLMDEPTSALDKDAGARVEALITALAQKGLAVVLVTHDLDQAARLAERAVLLAAGRVLASGPMEKIERAWNEEVRQ